MVCSVLGRNFLPRNFFSWIFPTTNFSQTTVYIHNTYSVHSDTIRCTVPSDTIYACTVSLYMYTVLMSLYIYVHIVTIRCTQCHYICTQCHYTCTHCHYIRMCTVSPYIQCTQHDYICTQCHYMHMYTVSLYSVHMYSVLTQYDYTVYAMSL